MKIQLQGHLVKVIGGTGKLPENSHKSKRGNVTKFSAKARKRLLEIIARLSIVSKCVFITLTYGQVFPTNETSKRHLKAFLRRIRKKYPYCSGVWRLEFQRRGAPHYHLILFNCPYWAKEDVAKTWAKIIGAGFCDTSDPNAIKPPFTRIELIRNHKHAMSYVSKYIAKVGDAEGGFNYVPYQNQSQSIGRSWGIFNRVFLPLGVLTECFFTGVKTLETFRFIARWERKVIKADDYGRGFTLFTHDIQRWKRTILDTFLDECLQKPIMNAARQDL